MYVSIDFGGLFFFNFRFFFYFDQIKKTYINHVDVYLYVRKLIKSVAYEIDL